MTRERTNTVTSMYPRLVVAGAARAIDFYVSALGAVETARHTDDNGKVIHSELKLGSMMFAVKDEDAGDPAPTTLGGSPVILALDVTDADAVGRSDGRSRRDRDLPDPRLGVRCPSRAACRPLRPPVDGLSAAARRDQLRLGSPAASDLRLTSNWARTGLVAGQIPASGWDP